MDEPSAPTLIPFSIAFALCGAVICPLHLGYLAASAPAVAPGTPSSRAGYAKAAGRIGDRRIVLAGYRLAGVLKRITSE
jgi:hypothetical protein